MKVGIDRAQAGKEQRHGEAQDCQTAAITMVQIAILRSISQSKRKAVQPRPLTSFWMPMPG